MTTLFDDGSCDSGSQIFNFLRHSFHNVRSSERTERLHKAVLDDVILVAKSEWKKYQWKFEYKVDDATGALGGEFKVDIAGFDTDDVLRVIILVKAINSNVNKNINNFGNTTTGEADRILYPKARDGSPRNLPKTVQKVLFVSMLPRMAPRFNTQGKVTGFDDVVSAKNRYKNDHILQNRYGDKLEVIDLFYDISDLRSKKTRADFVPIIVENLDPLVLT